MGMVRQAEMEVAVAAARAAGHFIMGYWNREIEIEYKGEVDLVSHVDRGAEELILGHLRASFPDDCIIGEEGGEFVNESSRIWFVDPLDGTTNFAHGVPHFCVSIGLVIAGEASLGVVYEPTRDFLFVGDIDYGATLNGRPIHVSKTETLDRSLMATGFPYDRRTSPDNNMDRAGLIIRHCQGLRRAGAAALDLAYVSAGWLDGYWEDKLHPWDVAAGVALVSAAGGRVSDFLGQAINVSDGRCVATNGLIHPELLAYVQAGSHH